MKRSEFPEGFLFGAATSAYQIEGHQFGGAGPTHWDSFAATPGNVVNAENGALGVDHYHRFAEDLDLVKAAGLDAYRFSISWARILPDGKGQVNQEGLDFYDRLTDAMLERGLKPCATLYHWEMPSALDDLGGWRNRDVAHWFADFTEIVMSKLGTRMHSVAPINEPWCVGWLSHFCGAHAPGLRDIRATARAMHHILLAHGHAIQTMRALGMKNLGGVFNMEWSTPADASTESHIAAARYDAIYNRFFLDGIFKGCYPDLVMEGLAPHMPRNFEDDFATIQSPIDWIGLNYYTRAMIAPEAGNWPNLRCVQGPLPKTEMGWEVYPQGLYKFLKRISEEYSTTLPIYVTENGMANADLVGLDGVVNDTPRIDYLEEHFAAARQALEAGVNLSGYFVWSLLDNYEWAFGYEKRFGLVHVDFETLERQPKASYWALTSGLKN